MDHTTQYPELGSLLQKYRSSLRQLHNIQHSASNIEDSTSLVFEHLSVGSPIIETIQQTCGDGTTVTLDHEILRQQHIEEDVSRLERSLCRLSGDINSLLYKYLYTSKMAKMDIQAWLDDRLWSLNMRTNIMSSQKQQQGSDISILVSKDRMTESYKNDMTTLSRVLNTLFSAERSLENNDISVVQLDDGNNNNVTEGMLEDDSMFLDQLHTWILNVASVYLKYADLQDYKYLLLHLMQSTNSTEWGVTMIQYIPDTKNILVFMVEFVAALQHIFSNFTTSSWMEDDYINCLEQLDIPFVYMTFVKSIFQQNHPLDDTFITCSTECFDLSSRLVDTLIFGIQTASSKKYSSLTKRLTQQVSQISIILTTELKKNESWSQQCHSERDDFVLQIVSGLLAVPDPHVWHFLPSLPFEVVSIPTLWEIVIKILRITDYAEPSNIRSVINQPPTIDSFIQQLKENQTQGVFMISCLTNMAISIPAGVNILSPTNSNWSTLGTSLVSIIGYALFTIAFVDQDLGQIYYKDVRDNFGTICSVHPFVISLLLRWTCDYHATMENMALYLFRSLPISEWEILKEDLVLLHQLLRQSELSTWITFAQYVIGHLNLGYRQPESTTSWDTFHTSHPWCRKSKQPFLSFATHEELAFILLDACQKYQPIHEFDKYMAEGNTTVFQSTEKKGSLPLFGSASPSMISSPGPENTKTLSHLEFLDWCWLIIQRLQLYHGPLSSRASDIDKCINLPFLRELLNHPSDITASHGALFTYVAFLLSPTSRHFLRFESNHGWMKLLFILRRGRCTAAIDILSEIVPAFVYLHGDDFFTGDNSLVDYLQNMVEHKKDPMLRLAAQDHLIAQKNSFLSSKRTMINGKMMKWTNDFWYPKQRPSGIAMIIGSHAWHCQFIDTISDLDGFSYLTLILHSWLNTIFRKEDWMWNEQYVDIVDDICHIGYCLDRQSLIFEMLRKQMERLEQLRSSSPLSITSSPKMTPFASNPRNAFKCFKNMLPDTTYPTLLTGEWSMISLTTSNIFKTPGVEPNSLWFAFDVLLLEAEMEKDGRYHLAQLLSKPLSPSLSSSSSSSTSSSSTSTLVTSSASVSASAATFTSISRHPSTSTSTTLSSATTTTLSSQFKSSNLDNEFKSFISQSKKPIEFYCIYRTLQHILVAPLDHPLTPLLLQLFFCLYFANVCIVDDNGISRNLFYGAIFFIKKQDQLAKLRDRIATLQTYHGQMGLTSPAKSPPSAVKEDRHLITAQHDEQHNHHHQQQQKHHEQLRQVYYAMWLWLGNDKLILTDDERKDTIEFADHFCPDRLAECRKSTKMDQWEQHQPWMKHEALWYDLIEHNKMKSDFDTYCWVDSEKSFLDS
ncbi:uncharacterized protein BX664DRAFT_361732 [Halteromyces radiatus]|uniref:uncharacterized protein n=1 Tax=Halteromyces radiatus TaxID=101107 RepID=UPI00221F01AC|nr:uncharacterized protein BX664DRAFT_361732 [Halteromyces radiatus]KAI8081586.1 hypothetical protein BX664DRAFT_361732 [Halteromyces radiatus]